MLHIITESGEVLAQAKQSSPFSSYGRPVWTVNVPNPKPGPVVLQGLGFDWSLELLAVIDGWAVLRDGDGSGLGVTWSDGSLSTGFIVDRETGEVARGLTVDEIRGGRFVVDGAVALPGSTLGCVFD